MKFVSCSLVQRTPTPTPPHKGEGLNRFSMHRVLIFLAFVNFFCSSAAAQSFLYYKCEDGTQFITMMMNESRSVYMQLDGRSHTLPRRLAHSGERFSKSGVSFWIRGDYATLKRSRTPRTICRATR